jgi:hypothetical protein
MAIRWVPARPEVISILVGLGSIEEPKGNVEGVSTPIDQAVEEERSALSMGAGDDLPDVGNAFLPNLRTGQGRRLRRTRCRYRP